MSRIFQRMGNFQNGMTAAPLDQNSFEEFVFKAFKNHKLSGYVDRQQVRSINPNLFFFKVKLLFFRG